MTDQTLSPALPAPALPAPALPAPDIQAPPFPAGDGEQRQSSPDLRRSLAVARRYVRKGAEQSLGVPDAMNAVIDTERRLAVNGGLTADEEKRFWIAYGAVQNQLGSPVQIRRRYNLLFFGTLLVMFIIHIYYISAQALINDVRAKESIVADYVNGLDPACAPQASASGATQAKPPPYCPDRRVSEWDAQVASDKLEASSYLLQRVASVILLAQPDSLQAANQEIVADNKVTGGDVVGRGTNYIAMTALKNLTTFVELFLLPAFYGLLGACAFVLRQFSFGLRDGSFTADSGIRYSLRLSIGVVAGLAIHWFVGGAGQANPLEGVGVAAAGAAGSSGIPLQTMSRFALSFLAGYGSEIVFSIMDRMVAALAPSRDDRQNAPAPAAQPIAPAPTGVRTGSEATPEPAAAPKAAIAAQPTAPSLPAPGANPATG